MNLLQETSKPVQMMKQTNSFQFVSLEDVQAKILEIPYKGEELSMMVLLPNEVDGLQEVKPGACGASCCCSRCRQHSACAGGSQNAGAVPGEQETAVCPFLSVESNGRS